MGVIATVITRPLGLAMVTAAAIMAVILLMDSIMVAVIRPMGGIMAAVMVVFIAAAGGMAAGLEAVFTVVIDKKAIF
jgi:hypothetical protein